MRVRYSFSSRKTRTLDNHNQHRKEFPALVLKLLDSCEIILEVLDARFVHETRNIQLENLIKQKNKQIIYVINKFDLVSKEKLKKELEKEEIYPYCLVSCKERRGSRELRDRIKIEAKKYPQLPRVNIGVIGYPNTGKSSIINLLAGRASAKTAPEAGFTKGIQKIRLSNNLVIIDSPGVIPEAGYSAQDSKKISQQTKVSARSWDKVSQPELMVHELMRQYPEVIENYYNIQAEGNSEILIEQLGRKKKFLLPQNQVDTDRTSRLIIRDWQEGKISKQKGENYPQS